ncbi:hypothetical protein [Streptomyces justiciae]|uniref:hypothetical protein n=1 Tax=Streptomyces justiciae TaxID=2780140 RepID=UPI002117C5A3|nr:hypothetical protein [Streptomyces justiciae]MCW8382770.1 hypothetical protein [Streptomyces justiciae]
MYELFDVLRGSDDLPGVVCDGPQRHVGSDILDAPGVIDSCDDLGRIVLTYVAEGARVVAELLDAMDRDDRGSTAPSPLIAGRTTVHWAA